MNSARSGAADYAVEFPSLRFRDVTDAVLEITISNPMKLNAVDAAMHRDLASVWRAVDQDPNVRAVLVRGDGAAFSAGGDLEMVEEMTRDFAARARVMAEAREIVAAMIACATPVVSAIRGVAVGAGLAVALLADVSVASTTARILDGHTRIGVAAGDHAALLWPLLCGLASAKYYLLLCEPLDGAEAARIGLVSRCVDDDLLDETAESLARRLAQASAVGVQWTKRALNNWLLSAWPIFEASLAAEMLAFTGSDAVEGVTAVRERRLPRFSSPA